MVLVSNVVSAILLQGCNFSAFIEGRYNLSEIRPASIMLVKVLFQADCVLGIIIRISISGKHHRLLLNLVLCWRRLQAILICLLLKC